MNFIQAPLFDSSVQDGERLTQLINGYIAYLKRNKRGESEPGAGHAFREDNAVYETDPDAATQMGPDNA